MELDVYCNSCKEHILQADTNTLAEPLIGSMFKVKKDMEWSMFSPHDTGLDLVCSLCSWVFHLNGAITVKADNGLAITGTPDKILETLGIDKPFNGKSLPDLIDEAATKHPLVKTELTNEKIAENKRRADIVFGQNEKKKAGRPKGSKTKKKKKKRTGKKKKTALETMGLE